MGAPRIERLHVAAAHHARIEGVSFDGAPERERGMLAPDRGRPGLGPDFKRSDADPYRIYRNRHEE